jgi:hypothetical protein
LGNSKSHTLRGKLIALRAYIKKSDKKINNLIMYLKLLEKQEQAKLKVSK